MVLRVSKRRRRSSRRKQSGGRKKVSKRRRSKRRRSKRRRSKRKSRRKRSTQKGGDNVCPRCRKEGTLYEWTQQDDQRYLICNSCNWTSAAF